MGLKEKLKKIGNCKYELSKDAKPGMNVPALLFLSEKLLKGLEEGAIEQITNVAFLPGIYKHAIALPDMHFGYGFPIGGVAALDYENGGLSPGGIGFDINCGVRLLRTNLTEKDVREFTKRRWKGRKEANFLLHKEALSNFYIFLMQYFLQKNDIITY